MNIIMIFFLQTLTIIKHTPFKYDLESTQKYDWNKFS